MLNEEINLEEEQEEEEEGLSEITHEKTILNFDKILSHGASHAALNGSKNQRKIGSPLRKAPPSIIEVRFSNIFCWNEKGKIDKFHRIIIKRNNKGVKDID